MCVSNLFSQNELKSVLTKVLQLPDSDISCKIEQCERRNFIRLQVINSTEIHSFILLKNLQQENGNDKLETVQDVTFIQPVFLITDNNNYQYAAFNENHLSKGTNWLEINNLNHLEVIMKNLAKYHAWYLSNKEISTNLKQLNIKECLYNNSSIINEQIEIDKIVGELEKDYTGLTEKGLLVESVFHSTSGCQNVLINEKENATIFLNLPSSKHVAVPPAYDALIYIFLFTDNKFRQKYFWKLINEFYKTLSDELDSEIASQLNQYIIEKQLRVLLIIVKLNLVKVVLNQEELKENIQNYFKYPLLNQEDIYEVISNKLQTNQYDLIDYTFKELDVKNGHVSIYYYLKIRIKINEQFEQLNLFVKYPVTGSQEVELLLELSREYFFYKTLIEVISNLGLNDLLDVVPKCYLLRLNGIFILDDMSYKGFLSLPLPTILDYEDLKSIFQAYAKFNATFLIAEELQSQKLGRKYRFIEAHKERLCVLDMLNDPNLSIFIDSGRASMQYVIEHSPELIKDLIVTKDELYEIINKTINSSYQLKSIANCRKLLVHGDVHLGNMLLKFNENKSVSDVAFVDFQSVAYSFPARDILHFVYLHSTSDTRIKYLDTLLEEYYSTFSKYLTQFNLNPAEVYPHDAFFASVKATRAGAISSAFMYATVTKADTKFREDLIRNEEKFKYYYYVNKTAIIEESWNNEKFQTEIKELVQDFLDEINSDIPIKKTR